MRPRPGESGEWATAGEVPPPTRDVALFTPPVCGPPEWKFDKDTDFMCTPQGTPYSIGLKLLYKERNIDGYILRTLCCETCDAPKPVVVDHNFKT